MNQNEAEQVYLYNLNRTEELINSMGDNPQAINTFITNTYASLSEKEPAFLWFSLGTIVSSSVGKNIQVAQEAMIKSLGQVESSNIVLKAFGQGNQNIFKNIVPIFLTYDEIGVEGCEQLIKSIFDNPFQNEDTLNALKNYSILQAEQSKIATSLGLPLNDSKVIEKLFSEVKNVDLAHLVAMGVTNEEQKNAQKIYKDEFVNVLLDPTLGWVGHQFHLDEIKILDKSYNFFDYIKDPADFDQRMAFAEVLLKAIEEGISSGALLKYQSDVTEMAELALWMGNPYTASNLIGETNGVYWGGKAEEHDRTVKDSVLAFLNPNSVPQETAIFSPVSYSEAEIFPSVFQGEHEIAKINFDPLGLFLANNPTYEVIANDVSELLASNMYLQTPLFGGTALWNPNIDYLQNSTYLAIYNDGENHYYQPYDEVRGITFPFIYNTETGVPLTMPILDAIGHYDHTSTIDTIYNNPEAFSTPSHINWYNPYWNQLVYEANQNAMYNYFKSITVDNFMNAVLAPTKSYDFSYDSKSVELAIKSQDVFLDNSGLIDLSSLDSNSQNTGSYKSVISSIELANGTLLKVNDDGNFVCVNCNNYNTELLESAANSMVQYI